MCVPNSLQKFICVLLFSVFSCKMYAACTNTYTTTTFAVGSPTSLPGLSVAVGYYYIYNGTGPGSSSLSIAGNITVNGKLDINNCTISIYGDVIVNACGTLTISNNANLNFLGTHIYVMPGGKLIFKNTVDATVWNSNAYIAIESNYLHLPNDPDPLPGGIFQITNSQIRGGGGGWRGISVSGGNGQPVSGTAYDGVVSNSLYFSQNKITYTNDIYTAQLYMNYVTIQNMNEGIFNYDRFGDTSYGHFSDPFAVCSGGGAVQLNYCGFLGNSNNVINFYPYTNWMPGTAITYASGNKFVNDRSYIRNTEFKNIVAPISNTSRYVYLYRTSGISILGCKFQDYPNYPGPSVAAVESNSSTIIIDQACNDPYTTASTTSGCINIATSEFNDMRMYGASINYSSGSRVVNTQFAGSFGIRNTAIDMRGCYNDMVLNNDVETAYTSGISPANVVGMNISGCTGFWVEGNMVRLSAKGNCNMIGILVNEAGATNNKIYRNTVKDMDYSLQANGLNYSDHHGIISGLRFLCNDLSHNPYATATDILVGPIPTGGAASYTFGISPFQGDGSYPNYITAGNSFASSKISIGSHIHNQSLSGFNYYWQTPIEEPVLYTGPVSKVFVTTDNTCSDNTACCGVSSNPGENTSMPLQIYINYSNYNSKKISLEYTIANTDCNSMVYKDLLRQYGQLVDAMVNTFLHAPDSLARYKGGMSFVQYHIDTLRNRKNNALLYDTTIITTDDPVYLNYDSIILVLDNTHYLYDFKLRLATLYRNSGDMAHALSTLRDIPAHYSLSTRELADLNNTIYLYSIEDSLYRNSGVYSDLSAADAAMVGNIAHDSAGKARYIAQAILAMYNNTYSPADVNVVGSPGNKGATPLPATGNMGSISLSPNPVVNELHIGLKNYSTDMSYSICDITGREVMQNPLTINGDNVVYAQTLNKGTYLVKILERGVIKEVQKFVKD